LILSVLPDIFGQRRFAIIAEVTCNSNERGGAVNFFNTIGNRQFGNPKRQDLRRSVEISAWPTNSETRRSDYPTANSALI